MSDYNPVNDLELPQSPSKANQGLSRFSLHQEWVFILKELRETLRDRRTTVTLFAMPLLLYPLLGLGFRFLAFQEASKEVNHLEIAFNTDEEASRFSDLMQIGNRALLKAKSLQTDAESLGESQPDESSSGAIQTVNPSPAAEVEPEILISVLDEDAGIDLQQFVVDGRADLAVVVTEQTASPSDLGMAGLKVQLIVNRKSLRSLQAADFVSIRLEAAQRVAMERLLSRLRIQLPSAVSTERLLVDSPKGESAALSLLPLILLLMTVTGGVYPAIDLTAGERERNTLETLVSLPVPKLRLLLAKFVAVVTVTMLTGLMNLLAMFVTLYSLQLDTVLLGDQGFTLSLAAKLFCVLSVFALFYSALLLFLTSSARSFKEAQAYLIPLLLLSIAPGLVILIPGWTLGPGSAVAPLVNILLLSRDLLVGQASFLPATVTLVSTLLYGLAALALAAQVFGTDAVAVGSRGLWRDVFHRGNQSREYPSPALSLGALAALFPAYFIASGLLSRGADYSASLRLALSAVLTVLLFFGLPWVLLKWQRVSLKSALAIRAPNTNYVILAVFLGLSTWPLIFEIIVLSHSLGFQSLDVSRFEEVQKLLEGWKSVPLAAILLAMAVAPGVCEELFFRGFLYAGVRQVLSRWMTVCVTAVIFGLFHFVLAGGAAPERMLPSAIMGLLLGWIRMRSNSLLPGIVLHVIHNASLLTIAQYREELAGWGLGGMHETHLPFTWIAAAAITTVSCILIVKLFLPGPKSPSEF